MNKEAGLTTRGTVRRLTVPLLVLLMGLGGWSQAEAQFGKNKIRYKDFDWEVYHSPHFDVYYYQEEAAQLQKVVSFAESAYDQLSQELDYKIEEPTPLIFYLTHADFEQNNIILNFIPEGLGAFASPVRNRMVLPIDMSDPELMSLILHELTHIFQYHIIFGGNLGKGITSRPPLWFMEGMASYFAQDETARDRMFLRDAVVNDNLPPVTADFSGFFAYRFGHAFFDFIEERWGKEAVRDFVIEIRNTLGGRVGRAIERSFNMSPEDFNSEFRRWLRKRYLPELIETGEPGDFGRPYRLKENDRGATTSPAAAPSGDLLAAFTAHQGGVDVLLFDNRNRRVLKNLTKGYETEFQYYVVQELTMGRQDGRDLSFSPDGNRIAFFARKNEGRELVLLDVLKGKIVDQIRMEVGQQASPAWSPDGKKIAFSAREGGQADIFEYELASGSLSKVTDDAIHDGAPVYTPDGQAIVLASVAGGYSKLYRIDLADRSAGRVPLTGGQTNETDPVFAPDGRRLYFTSDRTGANNIYSLDLETQEIRQHTNSVTGCFQPTVLSSPDGSERLVYTAFWKGNFDLYQTDLSDPVTEAQIVSTDAQLSGEALSPDDVARFEPAIEVAVDDANREDYGGFHFFIEDLGGAIGISDDQTFLASTIIRFSDFMGDRRIIAAFSSVESFQNFDVIYADLRNRWQWQVHLFDDRDFFIVRDQRTGFFDRGRRAISLSGLTGSLVYPINVGHRAEIGLGYIFRDLDFVSQVGIPLEDLSPDGLRELIAQYGLPIDPNLPDDELRDAFAGNFGTIIPLTVIEPRQDNFPQVSATLTGDSALFAPWGGVTGRQWSLGASWAPDTSESGTLTSTLSLEYRQYLPVTRRIQLAYRFFGSFSEGNFSTPIYFGGLDTVRGFRFRSLVGDQAFFQNIEIRFPLIDYLATPVFSFQGIRGVFFLDVAGAWFDKLQDFDFYNNEENRLEDGVASFGYGLSARIFGLDVNWDFAKRWDFDRTLSGFETSFWIGPRF